MSVTSIYANNVIFLCDCIQPKKNRLAGCSQLEFSAVTKKALLEFREGLSYKVTLNYYFLAAAFLAAGFLVAVFFAVAFFAAAGFFAGAAFFAAVFLAAGFFAAAFFGAASLAGDAFFTGSAGAT